MEVSKIVETLLCSQACTGGLRTEAEPGLYAWTASNPDRLHPEAGRVVYVGRSKDLAAREYDQHLSPEGTGWSTLRRSIGALLQAELELEAWPRSAGPSASNVRCYRFAPDGEERLSAWMGENLSVAVFPHPRPDSVEGSVIGQTKAFLNLKGWANPHRTEIMALRRVCAEEARQRRLSHHLK